MTRKVKPIAVRKNKTNLQVWHNGVYKGQITFREALAYVINKQYSAEGGLEDEQPTISRGETPFI